MLKKDRIVLFLLFLILFSCGKEIEDKLNRTNTIDSFSANQKLYQQINDSVKQWIEDSLICVELLLRNPYKIDSLVVINKTNTRLFTTLNVQISGFKNSPSDNILDYGGAKVNGKWYFFFMHVSTVVDRASYQDSMYAPLTFSELGQIAHEARFPRYTIGKDGKAYADDAFFDYIFKTHECEGEPNKLACDDSVTLDIVRRMHQQKLDKAEIEEIKKEMAESIRPPEPPKKTMLWWEILIGREEKKKRFD